MNGAVIELLTASDDRRFASRLGAGIHRSATRGSTTESARASSSTSGPMTTNDCTLGAPSHRSLPPLVRPGPGSLLVP